MLKEFRKNCSYVFIYELQQLAILSIAIVILMAWNPWGLDSLLQVFLICIPLLFSAPVGYFIVSCLVFHFFNPTHHTSVMTLTLLVLFGILFGFVHSQLVHFCSHNLFRPKWVNRFLGEILSLQFFGTFLGFTVLHLEHHAYADDRTKDPHSNEGEGFFRFFIKLTQTMAIGFEKIYFKHHGQRINSKKEWMKYKRLVPTRCFSRAVFLILLLGPVGFLFFFLPSMLSNYWVFGHLNYYSHLRKEDGTVEILNLNKKLSHKILNIFTLGAYNHANHHKAPNFIFSVRSKKVES